MPDCNGLDLISEFKKIDPEIEIIVLTAYAELDNAIRSVREGVSDFIAKPFDTKYLIHSIKRCIEMKKMKEQLIKSEKLRALGEMAAGIAHDFNNILFAMRVQLSLLRMKNIKEIEDLLKKLEEVLSEGQSIIDRLRKFYRGEKSEIKEVSLKDIIEEAITLTEPKWGHEAFKKGQKIEVNSQIDNDIIVKADPNDLREILVNLIFNAVEAISESGFIQLKAYKEDKYGVIEVKDSGHGIPEEIQKHIFEPFFTTKEQGTGLGLAICYRLIKNMGGHIEFESSPEEGTTFYLKLPLKNCP